MTQEVQPLTWQKRTNLEEHQQFFSKINEIIANLAPTVNEAEQAIAQANQAVVSANAAIATANAASANADAASQQAQAAAGTVAGYDARMAAVESKNTQQDSAISALQTADGQNVKLTGDQNIAGIKTVPTEATGTRSQQIANSAKVGAELDNYAPMVRTTGNQTKTGILTSVTEGGFTVMRNADFSIAYVQKNTGVLRNDTAGIRRLIPLWVVDAEDNQMFSLRYEKTGKAHKVYVRVVDSAGTQHDQTILQFTEE